LDALAAVSTVDLRVTDQSFNPNLWGSIKAITPPFIGDYVGLVADATSAYAVCVTEPDPARMPRSARHGSV
jgi:hypothetical protein